MIIKPVYDNLLLEPIKENFNSSKSGILLPNTIQDKPNFAKIIAISKECEEEKIFNTNDIVIFNKFAGTEFKIDNKDYILIKKNEILGILKE